MSEVSKLAKCAARGAGLSWGMADEAADATIWLAGYGLPGPKLLARLLQLNDNVATSDLSTKSLSGVWSAPSGRLCPLLAGAALNDSAQQLESGDIDMAGVTDPLLLVPFAASVALANKQGMGLEWQGVSIVTDGTALHISGNDADVATQCVTSVKCGPRPMPAGNATSETRVNVDTHCWTVLSTFAQRTYAPATETSRLLGAGASLDDND